MILATHTPVLNIIFILKVVMPDAQPHFLDLVRRSKLFVPVNRDKYVAKAWTRGADCIILDLEDAIAPADKASARTLVKDVIPIVNRGGADVQVRINRFFPELEKERGFAPGAVYFDIIVETAAGVVNIESIATANPRIAQMWIGLYKERKP